MKGYVYILMINVLDINKTDAVCAFNKKEDAIEALKKRTNAFNTDYYKVEKVNDLYYIIREKESGDPAYVYYVAGSRVM